MDLANASKNASLIDQQIADHYSNLLKFQLVNDYIQLVLMTLGLIGNTIGLITLCRSMKVPHYLCYKAMAIAELIYCLNYFVVKILNSIFQYQVSDYLYYYSNFAVAYFQNSLSHFVYSSCGYFALYMTVILSADRFCALWFSNRYQLISNRRKQKFAYISIAVSTILSTVVNSWAAVFQRQIVRKEINLTPPPSFVDNATIEASNNRSVVVVYAAIKFVIPSEFVPLFTAKDYYNLIIRVVYPFLVLFLTGMVIFGIIRYKRNKERLLGTKRIYLHTLTAKSNCTNYKTLLSASNVSLHTQLDSLSPTPPSMSPSVSRSLSPSPSPSATPIMSTSPTFEKKRRMIISERRRERNLFSLMITVVLLAFLQVIARETRRIFELICNSSTCGGQETLLDIEFIKVFANTATCIDRSLKFYLYFLLNEHFRKCTINLILLRKIFREENTFKTRSARSQLFQSTAIDYDGASQRSRLIPNPREYAQI